MLIYSSIVNWRQRNCLGMTKTVLSELVTFTITAFNGVLPVLEIYS